jgi:uncharacterized protein GlcG (DUF336 family)
MNELLGPDSLTASAASSRRGLLLGAGGAGLLAAGLVAAGPSAAAAQPTEGLTTQDLSLAQAQAVVAAAIAEASELGVAMDIAVVDAGANLKSFARMDGAWLGSIDIAIKKARTSRFFDFPTGAIGELSQPGGPLYQIEVSNGGLITFPGGVPLLAGDGTVIGAVGVSGSTVEDDHAVASAGAAALGGLNLGNPTS